MLTLKDIFGIHIDRTVPAVKIDLYHFGQDPQKWDVRLTCAEPLSNHEKLFLKGIGGGNGVTSSFRPDRRWKDY